MYKIQHVWADSLKEMGATKEAQPAYFSHLKGSKKEAHYDRPLNENADA